MAPPARQGGAPSSALADGGFVGATVRLGGAPYRVVQYLARGSFGRVYRAERAADRRPFALKRMLASTPLLLADALDELLYHCMFNSHPGVVRLYGCTLAGADVSLDPAAVELVRRAPPETPCEVHFLLELCPGGSLLDVLRANPASRFQEAFVWAAFARVVSCVCQMHRQGVTNRDLKVENLLFAQSLEGAPAASLGPAHAQYIRLCDFGSCTDQQYPDGARLAADPQLRARATQDFLAKTTPAYRAPEIVELGGGYPVTCKTDVFALGVLLYRMMYFVAPFPEGDLQARLACRFAFPDEPGRGRGGPAPPCPPAAANAPSAPPAPCAPYSRELKALVRRCLVRNPAERADIWELAAAACPRAGVAYEGHVDMSDLFPLAYGPEVPTPAPGREAPRPAAGEALPRMDSDTAFVAGLLAGSPSGPPPAPVGEARGAGLGVGLGLGEMLGGSWGRSSGGNSGGSPEGTSDETSGGSSDQGLDRGPGGEPEGGAIGFDEEAGEGPGKEPGEGRGPSPDAAGADPRQPGPIRPAAPSEGVEGSLEEAPRLSYSAPAQAASNSFASNSSQPPVVPARPVAPSPGLRGSLEAFQPASSSTGQATPSSRSFDGEWSSGGGGAWMAVPSGEDEAGPAVPCGNPPGGALAPRSSVLPKAGPAPRQGPLVFPPALSLSNEDLQGLNDAQLDLLLRYIGLSRQMLDLQEQRVTLLRVMRGSVSADPSWSSTRLPGSRKDSFGP